MPDEIQVQVRYTVVDANGNDFTDALYYPIAAWPVDQDEIDADKQTRLDAHNVAVSSNPPSDESPPE